MPRCKATKRDGKKCTKDAKCGDFCSVHSDQNTTNTKECLSDNVLSAKETGNEDVDLMMNDINNLKIAYENTSDFAATEDIQRDVQLFNFALQIPENMQAKKSVTDVSSINLHDEIIRLRAENAALLKVVKQLMQHVHGNSNILVSNNKNEKKKTRVPKQLSEKELGNRVKWAYYNEHKNDQDVLGPIQERLNAVGVSMVPWQYVRQMTDNKFMNISVEERSAFIEKIRSMYCFMPENIV